MKEIKLSKVLKELGYKNITNDNTTVYVEKEENHQPANFKIKYGDKEQTIKFQEGPLCNGINGIYNEDLLLMVLYRLMYFQTTEFKCDENEHTIEYIIKALEALRSRTNRRKEEGKLGTKEV